MMMSKVNAMMLDYDIFKILVTSYQIIYDIINHNENQAKPLKGLFGSWKLPFPPFPFNFFFFLSFYFSLTLLSD